MVKINKWMNNFFYFFFLRKKFVINMGRAFGIVSLIFGIISIPLSAAMAAMSIWAFIVPSIVPFVSLIGWIFPGIAIIFGLIGIIADDSKGMAIAGFILGIISLIIGFLLSSLIATFFASLIP
jgi:hypothetical protein